MTGCNVLQVNEDGKPVLDLAHVIECLNKLDIGSAEKVLLVRIDALGFVSPIFACMVNILNGSLVYVHCTRWHDCVALACRRHETTSR